MLGIIRYFNILKCKSSASGNYLLRLRLSDCSVEQHPVDIIFMESGSKLCQSADVPH